MNGEEREKTEAIEFAEAVLRGSEEDKFFTVDLHTDVVQFFARYLKTASEGKHIVSQYLGEETKRKIGWLSSDEDLLSIVVGKFQNAAEQLTPSGSSISMNVNYNEIQSVGQLWVIYSEGWSWLEDFALAFVKLNRVFVEAGGRDNREIREACESILHAAGQFRFYETNL